MIFGSINIQARPTPMIWVGVSVEPTVEREMEDGTVREMEDGTERTTE